MLSLNLCHVPKGFQDKSVADSELLCHRSHCGGLLPQPRARIAVSECCQSRLTTQVQRSSTVQTVDSHW
jgi:hypothetical protein